MQRTGPSCSKADAKRHCASRPAQAARSCAWVAAWMALALGTLGATASPASGQATLQGVPVSDRTVPKQIYFASFTPYYQGEYRLALKAFDEAASQGYRSTEGRWIDSICYHAMLGECFRHSGDLPRAMENYESALKLYLTFGDWLLRTDFPDQPLTAATVGARDAITWGVSTRKTEPGRFPDKVMIRQGRLDNETVAKQGGIIAPPQLIPIRPTEIARCTALAIRRRAQLLGPAAPHDALLARVIETLARRPAAANHWSSVWVDCQLGLAYAGVDRPAQAAAALQASLAVGGKYDHPLTGMALIELGRMAFQQANYQAAQTFFHEATIAAAHFGDTDVMEEGFRWGLTTFLVANSDKTFPPLANAAQWAKRHDAHTLESELYILLAENLAVQRRTEQAAAALDEARRVMLRTDLPLADTGSHFQFATGLVEFQRGHAPAGVQAVNAAIEFQRKGSLRLFQVALVDALYSDGSLSSDRVAEQLFGQVLREPGADDWASDPLESLAMTSVPQVGPFEHWFEVAMKRKNHTLAAEITDAVRRRRFYSTLPLGGRLLNLRWILAAPSAALGEKAARQRKDMEQRYPKFLELAQAAATARAEITALPLTPADNAAARRYEELYGKLGQTSLAQEMLLHEVALRRDPAETTFPPALDLAALQKRLAPGQLVLSYFATSRYVYAFAIRKEKYQHWELETPAKVQKNVSTLLRQWGHFERNNTIEAATLASSAWQATTRELAPVLLGQPREDFWQGVDEVVVVPDGVLWYLPFEALPAPGAAGDSPLGMRYRVRYVPFVALAVADGRGLKPHPKTGVVLGKLSPRDEESVAAATLASLHQLDPQTFGWKQSLPGPAHLVAAVTDRLVVLDDIETADRGPYDWPPLQLDAGKPGSSLGDWLAFPWGAAEWLVLPGFHTEAENSLKRKASGEEVFLAASGLLATGSRSVLLARWRTGGKSTHDLIREYLQELPHTTAANAWQRSVQLLREGQIDVGAEPRVKPTPGLEALRGEHPFFWAGFLLLDTGAGRAAEPAVPAADKAAAEKAAGEKAAAAAN